MRFAADFLQSKTTWTGIIGVAGIVCTLVLHRPDLVTPITGVIIALEGLFIRDAIAKAGEKATRAAVVSGRGGTLP